MRSSESVTAPAMAEDRSGSSYDVLPPEALNIFNAIKSRILMMKDIAEGDIRMNTTFHSLNFESLDYVEIQVVVLGDYGIKITEEEFSTGTVSSIGDIINLIIPPD